MQPLIKDSRVFAKTVSLPFLQGPPRAADGGEERPVVAKQNTTCAGAPTRDQRHRAICRVRTFPSAAALL